MAEPLLVLLDRRVGLDVLLELLVRQVRQDLLAVRADHVDLGGRGRNVLRSREALGGLGRRLLRRARPSWPASPWPRASRSRRPSWPGRLRRRLGGLGGGRLLGGRRSDRAGGGHVDVDRDAEGAQVLEEPLEVPRLDLRVVAGPAYVLGTESSSDPLLDQCDDGRVGEYLLRNLARVRGGHEHLFNLTGGLVRAEPRESGTGRGTTRCRQEPRLHSATQAMGFPHPPRVDERCQHQVQTRLLTDPRRRWPVLPGRDGC